MSTVPPRRLAPSRDTVTTIADDGSHVVLHPADVAGRFTWWRRIAAVVLIAVYVLLPWIPVAGKPALFFDLLNLRFHAFGLTLAPEDFWLAFFLITGLGFTLFYVTALFGRLWCGWACPQTVFLEHVYRRIERWLEGDAPRRRQLDLAPWNAGKFMRRGIKQVLFLVVSLLIAHVLLAYFVSLAKVWEMVTHAPVENWGVFLTIAVLTGLLYFNFAWFREQLCIIICPYGRLQSALIDDHSLTIGYDAGRGEPRGRFQRTEGGSQSSEVTVQKPEASGHGDCIDCFRCVQVCPTGIDIRQGMQLECIGCANCIDACDNVMDRLGRPRGLVRYDSLNGLAGRTTRFLRPRIMLYTALLLLGAAVAGYAVIRYEPAGATLVRMTGSPYYVDAEYVRNQFFLRVSNQGQTPAQFTASVLAASGAPNGVRLTGWESAVEVPPGEDERRPLVVLVPRAEYQGGFAFTLRITVEPGAIVLLREGEFVGPDRQLFHSHATPAP